MSEFLRFYILLDSRDVKLKHVASGNVPSCVLREFVHGSV
jgi:hypothetical protein